MNSDKIIKQLPSSCFELRNRKVYKIQLGKKPIYIFANHAAAVEVWLSIAKENAVNLIIFDDHNDSIYPFRGYRNSCLNRDNKKLMMMLNEMKANRDYLHPMELYQVGKYIKDYHCSWNTQELRNDEHNILGIFLALLNDVYICSPASDGLHMDPECPKELQICYQHLHCMQPCYKSPDTIAESICELAPDASPYIKDFAMSNMGDDLILRLLDNGLNIQEEYILDIDLDYFKIPFWRTSVSCFGNTFYQIVRNAKAITIATEPMYVAESADAFSYKSTSAENTRGIYINHKKWNSEECLHWLLRELEHMLSGIPL